MRVRRVEVGREVDERERDHHVALHAALGEARVDEREPLAVHLVPRPRVELGERGLVLADELLRQPKVVRVAHRDREPAALEVGAREVR